MADRTESQVNTSVKKFFSFLVTEQHITLNKDLLTGLGIQLSHNPSHIGTNGTP